MNVTEDESWLSCFFEAEKKASFWCSSKPARKWYKMAFVLYDSVCNAWATYGEERNIWWRETAAEEKWWEWIDDEWKKVICQCAADVWPTQVPDLFSRFRRAGFSSIFKHRSNDTWAKITGKERASLQECCEQVSAFCFSKCLCGFYVNQNDSQIPERDRDVLAKARRCDNEDLLV